MSTEGGSDLRSARIVAAGLLLSKPTGYLRDALLAARFGTGRSMDAFTVASAVAMAAFDIIGTPLQRVLVPVLVRARDRRGARGLAATAGAILSAATVAACCLGVLLLLGASPIATVLTGGGPLQHPTAVLVRWLSLLPAGLALSAYATAWLQAGEHFALPAFVGLPYDLAIIAFVLVGRHHGVLAAAWGLVVGAFLQYALQWPGLRHFGHRVRVPAPAAALTDPGLRSTLGMVVPLLVSVASIQAVNLLQQALAARLPVGSAAALAYALRVLDLPSALFILPVVTVILPQLARRFVGGARADAAAVLAETAWALSAGLLPCALLTGLLGGPLAAALYQHGAFGATSTAAMALGLLGFAPGVLTTGMQQLMRVYFYAQQDARTPMLWDVVALVCTAVLDLLTYHHWHQFGLALGYSVGAGVGWLGLSLRARSDQSTPLPWSRLFPLLVAAAALVLVTLALRGHIPAFLGHAPWRRGLTTVAVAGFAGAALYTLVAQVAGGGVMLRRLIGSAAR